MLSAKHLYITPEFALFPISHMHTHTLSYHVKLKAVKSPMKEASGASANPEQEEGDAIPRAGSWGEILELQRTQNT